jgi:hypothetical protein
MRRPFLFPASRGRRALLWALLAFVVSQAILGLLLIRRHPEVRDPEFGHRLLALRDRLSREPGKPLVVVLGSSRTQNGFWPAALDLAEAPNGTRPGVIADKVSRAAAGSSPACSSVSRAAAGSSPARAADRAPLNAPIVFNFGLMGAGPVRELMVLRRLLADGIRPDWVLAEVWAPLLPQEGPLQEREAILQHDLHWSDVPFLCRHLEGTANSTRLLPFLGPDAPQVLGEVIEGTLSPLLAYRKRLLARSRATRFLLPRLQAAEAIDDDRSLRTIDGTGWTPDARSEPTPAVMSQEIERGRKNIKPLLDSCRIHPMSDRALRELLEECQAHGIRAALFIMPEHSVLRGWYTPAARATFDGYFAQLGREHGIPVIDGRDWVGDDDFVDFCHMIRRAAGPYSARFGRDVLDPLLAGQPLAPRLLLDPGRSTPADQPPL